ncbi:MAG: hypothetical protein ABI679_14325 [Gemmatimonadota bacterium]
MNTCLRPRVSSILGFTLFLTIGCGQTTRDTEGPAFTQSVAFPDCAPWDGAAVSIYLTTTARDSLSEQIAAPFLHLAIWRNVRNLPGATISWPSDDQPGTASWCATADGCEPAAAGRVQVGGLVGDTTLSGSYDLRFTDSTVMRGHFRARWLDRRVLCG